MIYSNHYDKDKEFLIVKYDINKTDINSVHKLLLQADLIFGAWYNVVCLPDTMSLTELDKESYIEWLKSELESLEGTQS